MIGKVIRPEGGKITREEDRRYIHALFRYVNGLDGFKDGEPVHKTMRGYVMTHPETETLVESNAHPEVRDQEDIVIRFRNQEAKEAFDRWRQDGTWPEPVREQTRASEDGKPSPRRRPDRDSRSEGESAAGPETSNDTGSSQKHDKDLGEGRQLDVFARAGQ